MTVPYSYLEVESILRDYDEQVPIYAIADNVNDDFHEGKNVRNKNSIWYVISKSNNDDSWLDRLEEKWHKEVEKNT